MAFQIKTNEAGFQDALDTLDNLFICCDDRNSELFQRLNQLQAEWNGAGGSGCRDGGDCVYAHSKKKAMDIKQLRSDLGWAKMRIDLQDLALVKTFANNMEAMAGSITEAVKKAGEAGGSE